jgi:hypothetical protein
MSPELLFLTSDRDPKPPPTCLRRRLVFLLQGATPTGKTGQKKEDERIIIKQEPSLDENFKQLAS